jgi:hypothetical protein
VQTSSNHRQISKESPYTIEGCRTEAQYHDDLVVLLRLSALSSALTYNDSVRVAKLASQELLKVWVDIPDIIKKCTAYTSSLKSSSGRSQLHPRSHAEDYKLGKAADLLKSVSLVSS